MLLLFYISYIKKYGEFGTIPKSWAKQTKN